MSRNYLNSLLIINFLNFRKYLCIVHFFHNSFRIAIFNSIGLLYSQKLDSKAAFENYNQALEIRRKNKDLSGQAETLREMANLMSKLGKHKEAIQHLEEAQKLLQGKGTPIEQGLILDEIGDVYSSLGDFQKAVNYHKQSRILFFQAREMTLESLSIGTIISIYRNFTGDLSTSTCIYRRSTCSSS